jgi:hypothetical protein
MTSSGVSPEAKLSRMTDTIMRVPLMHALPWQTAGSTVMCCFQFIMAPFASVTEGESHRYGNLTSESYTNSPLVNLKIPGATESISP